MEPEIPDGATPEATPAHFDWLSVSVWARSFRFVSFRLHATPLQQGQVSAVADAVAPFKLPPIDVGPLRGGFLKSILVSSKAKEEAALALVASLKQHGFAVITNHGIDSTEIMAQTRALFKLSQRDKKDLAQVRESRWSPCLVRTYSAPGRNRNRRSTFWHGLPRPLGSPRGPHRPHPNWPRRARRRPLGSPCGPRRPLPQWSRRAGPRL